MTESSDNLPSVPADYRQVQLTGKPTLGTMYASAGLGAAGNLASDAAARALPALRRSPLAKVLPDSLLNRGGDRLSAPMEVPQTAHVVEGLAVDAEWHRSFCDVVRAPVRPLTPGSAETAVFSGALHALAFPVAMSVLTRSDFPLPVMGMVHLSNTVHHVMDVAVGEKLTATAWTENLRVHRAGSVVDAVVTLTRDDGTVVWAGRSGYLAKGRFGAIAGEGPWTWDPASSASRDDGSAASGSTARDAEEREPFVPPQQTAQWALRVDTGRRYAGVSGDYNPIHLSATSAKALGMKGAIAHGMYTASRALALTGVPSEVPFTWSVEFAAPVILPATVAVAVSDEGRREHWNSSRVVVWNPKNKKPHLDLRARPLSCRPDGP